jgi:hypothetical protein
MIWHAKTQQHQQQIAAGYQRKPQKQQRPRTGQQQQVQLQHCLLHLG